MRAAWIVWWIMIAVEPSGWGLKMRKLGEGLKVVLRSCRRAILIFLRRMSALKFCWEWSKLEEEWVCLIVDPVLYCRIRVDVLGCVMVGGEGGLLGEMVTFVGVAAVVWLGPGVCAQLLWRSA